MDGINQAAFADATIPDSTTRADRLPGGTDPVHNRKLSGQTTCSKRHSQVGSDRFHGPPITGASRLIDQGAQSNRKNLSLVLIDGAGDDRRAGTSWRPGPPKPCE
ncbi:MAG: hypothetical protein IPK02_10325 [Candidatus Accumulibacter sp.]|uniref:Uncharacterized protein n=1 Tax=Candidatus Accumulibacter affinis TaxID=2954384 RepID=A0A935W4V7_9PROT|nr:hypothetical protein [Candidatus Accumulibacter affinis]